MNKTTALVSVLLFSGFALASLIDNPSPTPTVTPSPTPSVISTPRPTLTPNIVTIPFPTCRTTQKFETPKWFLNQCAAKNGKLRKIVVSSMSYYGATPGSGYSSQMLGFSAFGNGCSKEGKYEATLCEYSVNQALYCQRNSWVSPFLFSYSLFDYSRVCN